MGWDKGKYYTRSRKVNGRVLREYVGGGQPGQLAAQLDALEREQRAIEVEALKLERAEIQAIEKSVANVCQMAEVIAHAAMATAGIHYHRGQWRKRRG